MTFKEKLKREHPHSVSPIFTGGCFGCPFTYDYERSGEGLCKGRHTSGPECGACWNREIPGIVKDGFRPNVILVNEWDHFRWPKKNPHLTANAKSKIKEKIYLYHNDVEKVVNYDLEQLAYVTMLNSIYGAPKVYIPEIKKVIFNDPATIVIWADGEKTVVKCQNGEPYDPEKGLAMAITKRVLGNKGNYFNEIKKWTKEYEEKKRVWKLHYDPKIKTINFKCPACGMDHRKCIVGVPLGESFNIPERCPTCGSKNEMP